MKAFFTFVFILFAILSSAQIEEVAIYPEGIVFPRMNTAQRNGLSANTGQCIFNTQVKDLECFDGTDWVSRASELTSILQDSDGDTQINVEKTADEDVMHFDVGGVEVMRHDGLSMRILGDENILGRLSVDNSALFNDDVFIVGNESINGDVELNGSQTIDGSLQVGLNQVIGFGLSVGSTLDVGSNQSIAGDLTVGEDVVVAGNQEISGSQTINGSSQVGLNQVIGFGLSVGSTLSVGTDQIIGGGLTVAENVSIGANQSITGSLEVVGQVVIDDKLGIGDNPNDPERLLEVYDSSNDVIARYISAAQKSVGLELIRQSGSINNTNRDWRILNDDVGVFSIAAASDGMNYKTELRLSPSFFSIDANVLPLEDDNFNLGSSSARWNNIFATNPIINTSDVRLKKNVQTLDYGIEALQQLRPVSYNWKGGSAEVKLGLIAQEVLMVMPEVVDVPEHEDGQYGISYTELLPVLIKAVQQLNNRIDELEGQISELLNK